MKVYSISRQEALEWAFQETQTLVFNSTHPVRLPLYYLSRCEKVRNYELENDLFLWFGILITINEVCPFNGFPPSNRTLEYYYSELLAYEELNPLTDVLKTLKTKLSTALGSQID